MRDELTIEIGGTTLLIHYGFSWSLDEGTNYEIDMVFVLVSENKETKKKYWRIVDWENEMYDPQFAHISTERLEKAIALDISKNVA